MNEFKPPTMRRITITQTGETFSCPNGQSILAGMARMGRRGIPAGCLGGGCGVCKVRLHSGRVDKIGPVSRAHVSVEEEADGFTLACRVAPCEDVELEVAGLFKKPFLKGAASGPDPTSSS